VSRSRVWLAAALALVLLAGAALAMRELRDSEGGPSPIGEGPFGPTEPTAQARPGDPRPNLVLIMTDDQEAPTLRYMPRTRALIGSQGVEFTEAQSTFPLCCPARATALTGQYAHNHGVVSNFLPGAWRTFNQGGEAKALPVALQRAGYNTVFVGRYLNGWGIGREDPEVEPPPVPPGWNEFIGLVGLSAYRMWGFTLDHNGASRRYPDDPSDPDAYQTDVIARLAGEEIRRYAEQPRPLMLYVAPAAPHTEENDEVRRGLIRPAPRDRREHAGLALPRTPSFNEADNSDKPAYLRERPPLTPVEIDKLRRENRARVQSLQAVDDLVARVVSTLRATGRLDDTVIAFTSDNGFLQGQHRIGRGKVVPYGDSARVPLLIRGPGFRRGARSDAVVANLDLAPTFLQLAGAEPLLGPDGISLVPLLEGRAAETGRDLLLENLEGGEKVPPYRALRTSRWLYVDYEDGEQGVELYDLRRDPDNLDNLASHPRYARMRAKLGERLAAVRDCAATRCRGGQPNP
jgi:N-acetylglucosamine-6-sulfatase